MINKSLSNSELSQSDGTQQLIGIECVYWHLPESLETYRVKFSFVITTLSKELLLTIFNQLVASELLLSFEVQLELVSPTEHGWKQALGLILKIRVPNFGAAMEVNDVLLLMNLEEQSTSPIFYDGRTVILSEWKSKEDPSL